ncbi:YkgJ family cysteine cluster protein [Desulfurivibrio sp. D14AmB]|uniref:YkgJ family cysteine cluster protein n=1 Tax=Desulfurivibrio sp. D14AmB TaxID=3374370 RepID=UPI00376EA0E1
MFLFFTIHPQRPDAAETPTRSDILTNTLVCESNPVLERTSPFSYACRACGRCCHNKRIQTNPYEILRLARNRSISTGEFIHTFLEVNGPYLRIRDDAACVFLADGGCAVHPDRPLACRTYPLGRWVDSRGRETFRELKSSPQCEGVYGESGTVDAFLGEQGAQPYMDAANRYQALFYRIFETLQRIIRNDADLPEQTRNAIAAGGAGQRPDIMKWLDVDGMVAAACQKRGTSVPLEMDQLVTLHIATMEELAIPPKGEEG